MNNLCQGPLLTSITSGVSFEGDGPQVTKSSLARLRTLSQLHLCSDQVNWATSSPIYAVEEVAERTILHRLGVTVASIETEEDLNPLGQSGEYRPEFREEVEELMDSFSEFY